MGGSMRGRKSWEQLSQSQKTRITQRKSLTNFKKKYFAWLDGKREKKPLFFKDNPFINDFLVNFCKVKVSRFNGNSEENQIERKEQRRETARKYYEKNAKKVNRGNSYTSRGPQPSRIHKEEQERIDNKPIDYQSLSDEEKLQEHKNYQMISDIKKGWRCVICKKMFTEKEEDSKASTEHQGGEVYYHPACNQR